MFETPTAEGLTFAILLSAAGAGIAAGLVTTLISLVRTAFPPLANVNGATLAFIASAVLYVLAGVATHVSTFDAGLGVVIAWLTCAGASVAAHELVTKPVVAQIKSSSDSGSGDEKE